MVPVDHIRHLKLEAVVGVDIHKLPPEILCGASVSLLVSLCYGSRLGYFPAYRLVIGVFRITLSPAYGIILVLPTWGYLRAYAHTAFSRMARDRIVLLYNPYLN